ncbi:MAG: hypothetical protein GX045_02345 [Clostridiaceae bacterium]|nr:hypothetical protein [Clostridiaceae bacterium]
MISTLPGSAIDSPNRANLIVCIEVSMERIENMLSQLAVYENSGAFMASRILLRQYP